MNETDPYLVKRKQNFDLIKFILGTVVLGLTAHFINLKIQTSQIELEVKKAEVEYLDKFIPRYVDASLKKKLDFVDFMRHASHSEETRTIYNKFYNKISNNIDSLIIIELESKNIIDSLQTQNTSMRHRIDTISSEIKNSSNKKSELQKELALSNTELEKNKRLLIEERKKTQEVSKEIGNSSVKISDKSYYKVGIDEKLKLLEVTLTPMLHRNNKLVVYCSYNAYDDTETIELTKNAPEKLFSHTGLYIITFLKYYEESKTANILVETFE